MIAVSINTRPSIIAVLMRPSASGWREIPSAVLETAMPMPSAPPAAASPTAKAAAHAFDPVESAAAALSETAWPSSDPKCEFFQIHLKLPPISYSFWPARTFLAFFAFFSFFACGCATSP